MCYGGGVRRPRPPVMSLLVVRDATHGARRRHRGIDRRDIPAIRALRAREGDGGDRRTRVNGDVLGMDGLEVPRDVARPVFHEVAAFRYLVGPRDFAP